MALKVQKKVKIYYSFMPCDSFTLGSQKNVMVKHLFIMLPRRKTIFLEKCRKAIK